MTIAKASILSASSLAIIALTAWGTYSVVNAVLTPQTSDNNSPNLAPTEKPKVVDAQSYCPLNGLKYKLEDQLRWEQTRPVAVMIENHPDSRPQSGLSSADVVYEAVAEGGITRFMALYLCDPVPQWVGPVRSSRTYFLDWVSEYNSLYAHVGGANTPGRADALTQIQTYGIKSLNEIPLGPANSLKAGYQRIYDRNPGVSLEHTMYLNLNMLRQYAQDTYDWGVISDGARWDSTFEKWQFADQPKAALPANAQPMQSLSYEFWQGIYGGFGVQWNYNSTDNTYTRELDSKFHIDKNTNQQLAFTNVIVLLQKESRAGDGYPGDLHLVYDNIGTGEGYMTRDGQIFPITWEKSSRTARTKFKDSKGLEIPLTRGKVWITIVPSYSKEYIAINGQSVSGAATSAKPSASTVSSTTDN